jgi:hypothetical protein
MLYRHRCLTLFCSSDNFRGAKIDKAHVCCIFLRALLQRLFSGRPATITGLQVEYYKRTLYVAFLCGKVVPDGAFFSYQAYGWDLEYVWTLVSGEKQLFSDDFCFKK